MICSNLFCISGMVSRENLWKHICFAIMCKWESVEMFVQHVAIERGLVQTEKKRRKAPRQHENSYRFIDIFLLYISGRMFLFKGVQQRKAS